MTIESLIERQMALAKNDSKYIWRKFMAQKLYITSTEAKSGKSAIALGLMEALRKKAGKVGFFRPIVHSDPKETDIEVVKNHFQLPHSHEEMYAYHCKDFAKLTTASKSEEVAGEVVKGFRELEEKNDFVLCEGTDLECCTAPFEFDLNVHFANTIGSPVLLVLNGEGKKASTSLLVTKLALEFFKSKNCDVIAVVINNVVENLEEIKAKLKEEVSIPCYVIGEKINLQDHSPEDVIQKFASHVPTEELVDKILAVEANRVSPRMFEYDLIYKAKQNKQHIVLPEGTEERILKAAETLRSLDIVDLTLLGKEKAIQDKIKELGLKLDDVKIVDPATSPKLDDYAKTFYELRKHKGVTEEKAKEIMADESYFGTMMVYKNEADALVSGSVNTTQHTIRPALQFVKTKPGFSIVSSIFFMCLPDKVLVFADCAVNPNPTPEQMAEIAISSADTTKSFGIEPRVAMLTYSTGSSGKGASVEHVIKATQIVKEKRPDIKVEGPIQYDAAVDPGVAKKKLPESEVAGKANVFIFPDLNSGNISYKAVQRSANALAVGPVLQGLNRTINDLSRGCTIPDIVNTVAITAIQAQGEKQS